MHLAKQRPPGVRTDLGWSPGSHTDAGICLVGSLNHSAPALGLCAAASAYLDFRAARETSVGEPGSLLCPCREETLPGNLPWRAQRRSARWRRSTVLRRAVCALVCSLVSLRMSSFCHSNCSLFAEQIQPARSQAARKNSILVAGAYSPLKKPLRKPMGSFSREKSAGAKYPWFNGFFQAGASKPQPTCHYTGPVLVPVDTWLRALLGRLI